MYVSASVALVVPPAVLPAGHVIPLPCGLPLYVFAAGLLGIVSIFTPTIIVTFILFVAPVVVSDAFTVNIYVPAVVPAFAVIVVPLIVK